MGHTLSIINQEVSRMGSRISTSLKSVSIILVVAFLAEQVAWAAPDFSPSKAVINETPKVELGIPESVATIEDSWIVDGGSWMVDKGISSTIHNPQSNILIYRLQDAHTNES